jgi:DNA-binding NarL/FixJ family response regulator
MTVPGVRIILFTMYSERVGSYLTSAIGVDAVLSKPDGMTALVKAIDAALNPISALIEGEKPPVERSEITLTLSDENESEKGNEL